MAQRRDKNTVLSVDVVGMGRDGCGLARHGELELRIAGALPGDRVEAVIEHRSPHRPVAFARLQALEQRSPQRRDSPCVHGDRCGGCPLIALDDDAQQQHKLRILELQLEGQDLPVPTQLIRTAPALGYRRRAKYLVFESQGQLRLGAYQRRSHQPTPTENCPVVRPAITAALPELVATLQETGVGSDRPDRPGLRYLQLRTNHLDQLLLTLVARRALPGWRQLAERLGERIPGLRGVTADLNDDPGDALLSGESVLLWGSPTLTEKIAGCELELDPYAFCQLHGPAGERLVADVVSSLDAGTQGWVADLYAGVGAFGLALARQHRQVVAVERHLGSCLAARRAARSSGLGLEVVVADSAAWLAGLAHRSDLLAAAVVDPPRRGLGIEAVQALCLLRPAQLFYVSCHLPAALRDLNPLREAGYQVVGCRAYDLFPQTPQIELVIELRHPDAPPSPRQT